MNTDSIKLLKECDAGIKMGITSLEDAIKDAENNKLKKLLTEGKDKHIELQMKTEKLLTKYDDEGKDPAALAKAMAKMKTNMKMMGENKDGSIADIITDGCDMGIKSLNRYLNQYPAADAEIKQLTGEIILAEEELERTIRPYL